ncbi:Luminal-binding protein 4 [Diplonema papillatum]|nr:Luminal-binding protein 4 [Diplonema papillatum]
MMLRGLVAVAAVAVVFAEEKEKEKADFPVVGIDLGTTYSVVGIYQNDKVEIIPNELGHRITPSVVAFTPDGREVGDSAKNAMSTNPENTIYAVKRLIGRGSKDKTVQDDMKILSYKVVAGKENAAAVEVTTKGGKKVYTPEEISAMILQKMKEVAQTYLGQDVKNAVVTVPAYFNDAQRQATRNAGTISGLNVLRILNEPTAAAIAYGLDSSAAEKKVLVFDLGGGTFDVSLLSIDNGFFEVEATNGDTHLGGEDFDNRIMQHFVKVMKKKHGKDITSNQVALARLRKAAENAKRKLSTQPEARVEVEDIVEGVTLSERLARAKFEELNADLFKGTLEPVKAVLDDANLEKKDIDEVVLVGGSTRIPKIQSLIKDFFNGKEPNRGINPDEAVAYGAAVQGGVLCGEVGKGRVVLVDVISLSLGIETIGGIMLKVIPRNSIIPSKKSQTVTTTVDNQPNIVFQVFEGERSMTKDNRLLGSFDLTGIKVAPKGIPQVEVEMNVDESGILQVNAKDKDTGAVGEVEIKNDRALSQDEIDRMVEEATENEEEDKLLADKTRAKIDLQQYLDNAKSSDTTEHMSEDDKELVEETANDAKDWLDEEGDEATKEEFEGKLAEVKEKIDSAVTDANAKKEAKRKEEEEKKAGEEGEEEEEEDDDEDEDEEEEEEEE